MLEFTNNPTGRGHIMKIPVIFADASRGTVRGDELQELIQKKRVACFQRGCNEWVKVGVDPTRGTGGMRYRGPERRGDVFSNC